ncbi:MAG: hypothetical protein WKF81_01930 [Thermomicrobiales bacterium]
MNWLIQIVIAIVVLLFGTSPFSPEGAGWVEVSGENYEDIIVSIDAADGFGTSEEGFWMPTAEDIEAAESALSEREPDLDHIRQYAGVIQDGDRKVFINGFCDSFGRDWRTQIITVDDGGSCYFSAMYNADSDELDYFNFNGQG